MKKNLLGFAAFALILTSCQENEIIEHIDDGNNQLEFGVYQGKVTKALELTNDSLKKKGVNFPLYGYKGKQSELKEIYFEETLTFNGTIWETSIPRFLFGSTELQFYAYFPQNALATTYNGDKAVAKDDFPELTHTVGATQATQVDLVAARVNDHTGNKVVIPFRHILSQINFGVKGYYGAKITISDIEIHEVRNKGTYSFNPNATSIWKLETGDANYGYRFGDGVSSDVSTYTTPGGENKQGKWEDKPEGESNNTYIFGDGGQWGPGSGTGTENLWYINKDNNPIQGSKINTDTDSLFNALMLMPQPLTSGMTADYVTFKYTIQDLEDTYIIGALNTPVNGKFDLNMINPSDINPQYDNEWKPNMRYLYIIDFKGYLDGQKLTFDVDVDMQPWENYDKPGQGIVLLSSLDGTVFDKNIKVLTSGGIHDILEGHLFSHITWDWSLKNMGTAFTTGQSFTVKFSKVNFNGNEIIIIPPFGFTVSTNPGKGAGVVDAKDQTLTFTAATFAYYGNVTALNNAITAITAAGGEFNASNDISLKALTNVSKITAGKTLILHFATAYSKEATPPHWAFDVNKKTATYTAPTIP